MPVSATRPLTRDRAWACVMQNIATPGIGTLKARRIFAGIGQLSLAIISCFLIGAWVIGWSYRIYQAQIGETVPQNSSSALLEWGIACFGVSWLWTLITGVSLMLQTKTTTPQYRKNIPPRLAESPAKPPKLSQFLPRQDSK